MSDYNNDKKIAQFLGAKSVHNEERGLNNLIREWNCPHLPLLHGKHLSGHEFKFSSDWNWLHMVMTGLEKASSPIIYPTGKHGAEAMKTVYERCLISVDYCLRMGKTPE